MIAGAVAEATAPKNAVGNEFLRRNGQINLKDIFKILLKKDEKYDIIIIVF